MPEGPTRDYGMRVLASNLYSELLLAMEGDGRTEVKLAQDARWEDEGRSLLITLRPGVRFHDGTAVTAQAVAENLRSYHSARISDPRYVGGVRHVRSIEAPDELNVRVSLNQPDSFLLTELTQVTIQRPDAEGIGTGPFRLTSRDSSIQVERFDDYHRDPSAIQRITITPFDSQRSAWAALLRGEVDAVQEVHRDSVEFMEGSTQIKTFSSLRPFYIMLAFNLRNEMLRDSEVRRAVSEAVDREEIVREALRGLARLAENPIWPDHWALSGAAHRWAHNPEASRLRLERAGLPLRSARQQGMPLRFKLSCLFWNEDSQFERMALLLQRQLLNVGVDLQLTGLPIHELVSRAGTGQFETVLMPVRGGRSLDVTYEYWRSPASEAALRLNLGYAGADDALDRLRMARTDAEVRTAVADLQQRFYEDAPAVFIAWQETTRAVGAGIDVSDRTDPDIFTNIWRWRRAEPER